VITVCCIKAGTKYGVEYVNRLHNMVSRNVHSTPYEFVCFTERELPKSGFNKGIRFAPLPTTYTGWWHKMGLYKAKLPGVYTEKILYIDLDVVVAGELDTLMAYESDFATAKDWPTGSVQKDSVKDKQGNTSVVLLKVGSQAKMWDRFSKDPAGEIKAYIGNRMGDGDQEWINKAYPECMDLLPEKFVQSYKLHKLQAVPPSDCAIVMFHGTPKPHECGGWVKEFWR
jgi:hypothetical protein